MLKVWEIKMESQELDKRGRWGSKVVFIFAAAGSAIGLGNIWRFPMMVGLNGGAIFVLVNIVAIILIGFTVMLAAFALGRHTKKKSSRRLQCYQTPFSLEAGWLYGSFRECLHLVLLRGCGRMGPRIFL